MLIRRLRPLLFICVAVIGFAAGLANVAHAAVAPGAGGDALHAASADVTGLQRPMMYRVTLKDNRATITLRRGDYVTLALDQGQGAAYNWQNVMVDANFLRRIATTNQGVYIATQRGTTTITALGEPKCRPRCGAPSIIFTVNVVIQ